jgi:hypothetical protein
MIFVTGLILVILAFWGDKTLPDEIVGVAGMAGLFLMGISMLILLSRVMP